MASQFCGLPITTSLHSVKDSRVLGVLISSYFHSSTFQEFFLTSGCWISFFSWALILSYFLEHPLRILEFLFKSIDILFFNYKNDDKLLHILYIVAFLRTVKNILQLLPFDYTGKDTESIDLIQII